MAIRNYKPTTNARRGMSTLVNEEITAKKPEKSLLAKLTNKAGRNNQGKITVRHQGGGEKRKPPSLPFPSAANTVSLISNVISSISKVK